MAGRQLSRQNERPLHSWAALSGGMRSLQGAVMHETTLEMAVKLAGRRGSPPTPARFERVASRGHCRAVGSWGLGAMCASLQGGPTPLRTSKQMGPANAAAAGPGKAKGGHVDRRARSMRRQRGGGCHAPSTPARPPAAAVSPCSPRRHPPQALARPPAPPNCSYDGHLPLRGPAAGGGPSGGRHLRATEHPGHGRRRRGRAAGVHMLENSSAL